jgi:hypothetical protein
MIKRPHLFFYRGKHSLTLLDSIVLACGHLELSFLSSFEWRGIIYAHILHDGLTDLALQIMDFLLLMALLNVLVYHFVLHGGGTVVVAA